MRVKKPYSCLQHVAEWSKKYANLPDRYIKRAMEQVYYKTPNDPRYLPRTVQRTQWQFTTHRPWTREFYFDNYPGKKVPWHHVEPIKDWSFFRGDRVEVLVGRDKGKQGIVQQIIQERNWIIVEGLNTKLVSMGKTKKFPGIFILEEQPLLVTTDVALVDPSDLQSTKIDWRYTEEGEKVRVSIRTGRIIPIPLSNLETIDYKHPNLYREQAKDTTKANVEKITFKPVLKTFEMDIMDSIGIKEDRIPKKTFWY
ncbi:probable 39S ribosomal protein L24, mitochondrial isoform X1 [Microplitis demolitor]|uniref:probable 39S ribosomal protein L24, mitochondrial isoform X1 n=1 Tax=Microplitis demolitor TaxID=69319 RepID=UPI0004CCE877|nr:probable 39S ribosomal protein L24, mitochondrial isoform X1 [Microplitis demolitor]